MPRPTAGAFLCEPMGTFQETILIDAPPATVWSVLSDIGNIAAWNPGVVASRVTTESSEGEGACRHCDLGRNGYLEEKVVQWRPNEAITFRVVDTNMPFESCDIRFTLHQTGPDKTTVQLSPLYKLKYGPFGSIVDLLMVRGTYRRGMKGLLQGLKRQVESL